MIVPRRTCPCAEWDAFVERNPLGWIWHLSPWLEYLEAGGRRDDSVAVKREGHVLGIDPRLMPVLETDPLPLPLGLAGGHATGEPARRRSLPAQERTPGGFETLVIDLSRPMPDLWRDVRRSYHALIHRAAERYTVTWLPGFVGTGAMRLIYRRCVDLPQLADDQWRCLDQLARSGLLRLGVALHKGETVGVTAVYLWKRWAYYGHGRSLETGVAHLLQWETIKMLKTEGWPYYELGWMAHDGDDEKARQIAHFKAGFGGEPWWIPVTEA